jgi:hypothetical protein
LESGHAKPCIAGVAFDFPEDDQTPVQVDVSGHIETSTAIEVVTLYKHLVSIEKQKKIPQVSFCKLTRESKDGKDSFSISVEERVPL